MRVSVEKQINDETKEVWFFNLFDLNIVLFRWHREIKPKGKRKWTVTNYWDTYAREKANEPELPNNIRTDALFKVIERMNVLTWDEWEKL